MQDSWRIAENLTVTAGVRYGLYAPPYEVNGQQVAPTVAMGDFFAQRGANGLAGIPSNTDPIITFDLAGPKNGGKGFYEWDKNNFAPRLSVAWTPRGESGFKQWLTGGDKMVVRAGYSKVFDRIGQGIALNFDQSFAFGMSTSHQQPVRRSLRDDTRGAFREQHDDAADDADGASGRLPADAADRGRHHHVDHRRHAGDALRPHGEFRHRPRAEGQLRD